MRPRTGSPRCRPAQAGSRRSLDPHRNTNARGCPGGNLSAGADPATTADQRKDPMNAAKITLTPTTTPRPRRGSSPPRRSSWARVAPADSSGRARSRHLVPLRGQRDQPGARVHWHPYPETWFVLEGNARSRSATNRPSRTPATRRPCRPASGTGSERRRGEAANDLHDRLRRHHPDLGRRALSTTTDPPKENWT